MAKTWSKKKKAEMNGKPHRQTPDTDNLLKALWDTLPEDSHLSSVTVSKIWGYDGAIKIGTEPTVLTAYAKSLEEVEEHMEATPIEGIAWDLAEQVAKQNGWPFKSRVSGKEWAAMVITLDKLKGQS